MAQTNPVVSVKLYAGNFGAGVGQYAGLTISGSVGTSYLVQSTTNLTAAGDWLTLTNLALPSSPYLWYDGGSQETGLRFYRVVARTLVNPDPARLAFVPAGSFLMGDSQDGNPDNDAPTNMVYVSNFYMDKYLVTDDFWNQIYAWSTTNGYSYDNAGSGKAADHPVQTVNWCDVVKWCNARSQFSGLTPVYYTDAAMTQIYTNGDTAPYAKWNAGGYRLPTEAEWEKAARGGLAGQRFPWGNTISETNANYFGDPANYSYDLGPIGFNAIGANGDRPYTTPVTSFAPNGYGLYDMAGNVWEWCWDWYGTYSGGSNPQGPATGSYRVFRGGLWNYYAVDCRSAMRGNGNPGFAEYYVGFRAVVSP